MKNRILIFLIIIIGVASIVGGIILGNTNATNNNVKKDPSENIDTNYKKKYKGVEKQEEYEFSKQTEEDVKQNYKASGFDELECNNNNCMLSKAVGEKQDHFDSVKLTFENDKIIYLFIKFLYLKKDFNSTTVTTDLNTVINNYFGYTLTEDIIKTGFDDYTSKNDRSNYTIRLNKDKYLIDYIFGEEDEYYFASVQIVEANMYQ